MAKYLNKLYFFSLILIIIISNTSIFKVSALQNSKNISSSGKIYYGETSSPVRNLIISYGFNRGFNDEQADFIAEHFNLLDADYNEESIPGFRRMKSRNPGLIIIVYKNVMATSFNSSDWDIVNQHEDWFIHDINGNRIQHNKFGWYLMDVGNEGWLQYYASWCEAALQEQSIDGIFADDVWNLLPAGDYPDTLNNPWTVPNSYINGTIGERWHIDMIDFIIYVKQRIQNKLLIINTVNMPNDYLEVSDGAMEEEFVHPSWYSYDVFHDDYINWVEKVDKINQANKRGKYILVHSGFSELRQSPDKEIVDKMLMYCFSSFLLALHDNKASFSFGSIWNGDGSLGYYNLFNESKALGNPINDYYLYQSIYARDFENGKVLVNPSNMDYTISLEKEYRNLDDQIVSSITLRNHSGIILLSKI